MMGEGYLRLNLGSFPWPYERPHLSSGGWSGALVPATAAHGDAWRGFLGYPWPGAIGVENGVSMMPLVRGYEGETRSAEGRIRNPARCDRRRPDHVFF